jgi:DNA-binding MarR family transcriptional regulator
MAETRNAEPTSESNDPAILLGVLSAIESDAGITQRKLSLELGIALGLTNAYLKRCARKGWIKITQVPMRRYAYYLTPQGFSEKARLTGDYLSGSLRFFRKARDQAAELFRDHRKRGLTRIVLVGSGDLAEVAALSALEADVEVIGVVDPAAQSGRCAGRPIFTSIKALRGYLADGKSKVDAIVITATNDAEKMARLADEIAAELGVSERPRQLLAPGIRAARAQSEPEESMA